MKMKPFISSPELQAQALWSALRKKEYEVQMLKGHPDYPVETVTLKGNAVWLSSGHPKNVLFVRRCDKELFEELLKISNQNVEEMGAVVTGTPGIGKL